jgi:hypothetical protein
VYFLCVFIEVSAASSLLKIELDLKSVLSLSNLIQDIVFETNYAQGTILS